MAVTNGLMFHWEHISNEMLKKGYVSHDWNNQGFTKKDDHTRNGMIVYGNGAQTSAREPNPAPEESSCGPPSPVGK